LARDIKEIDPGGRHPFRSMFKLALFAGLLYAAGRFVARKKDEFADLTESQARAKLVETMGPRVGDDTASEIADQVIPKLKDRGLLKSDPVEAASDEVMAAADKVAAAVEEATDSVADAVESVVKD
jgi:hypothetical protein